MSFWSQERSFSYKAFTDWSFCWKHTVLSEVRTEYLCVIYIQFVFPIVIINWTWHLNSSYNFNFFSYFLFFFYWHYNPLWVLAFSVILFHSALSLHCFLHRLIPIICISSSISAIHLFLGLPLILVPIGFHCNILLGDLLSSIRITWPNQAILLLFINLTISAFSISSFSL